MRVSVCEALEHGALPPRYLVSVMEAFDFASPCPGSGDQAADPPASQPGSYLSMDQRTLQ